MIEYGFAPTDNYIEIDISGGIENDKK